MRRNLYGALCALMAVAAVAVAAQAEEEKVPVYIFRGNAFYLDGGTFEVEFFGTPTLNDRIVGAAAMPGSASAAVAPPGGGQVSLSVVGDTWGAEWVVTNTTTWNIDRVIVDLDQRGLNPGSVMDFDDGDCPSTPWSRRGKGPTYLAAGSNLVGANPVIAQYQNTGAVLPGSNNDMYSEFGFQFDPLAFPGGGTKFVFEADADLKIDIVGGSPYEGSPEETTRDDCGGSEVPTMTGWGMLILLVLLILSSVVVIRNRRARTQG